MSNREDFELVIPTRAGRDLTSPERVLDGHIRIETYREIGTGIYVDLFDSSISDANKAHLKSEVFPHSDEGAAGATKFLQRCRFRVVVMIR